MALSQLIPFESASRSNLGLEGLHSARRGDYRVIYRIDENRHRVMWWLLSIVRISTGHDNVSHIRHAAARSRPAVSCSTTSLAAPTRSASGWIGHRASQSGSVITFHLPR